MKQLNISNVSKNFKSKKIINNVNYTFEPKHIYCLSGPNGSGKTTLFNIIANLTSFKGDVFFDSVNTKVINDKLLKYVCYIPQFSCLFERSTLQSNYELCQRLTNQPIESLYNPNKRVSKLSGGQKKMSNLARINDSYEIYLLDEPTIYLDKTNKQKFFKLLENLKEKNKIIIIISHDQKMLDFSDIVLDINQIQTTVNKPQFLEEHKLKKTKNSCKIKYRFQEFFKFLKENVFALSLRFFFLTIFMMSLFVLASFSAKDKCTQTYRYAKENFSTINLIKELNSQNTFISDSNSGLLDKGYLSEFSFMADLAFETTLKKSPVKIIMYDDNEKGISISDFYAYNLFNTTDETKIIGQEVVLQNLEAKKFVITQVIKSNYWENRADSATEIGRSIMEGCQFIILPINCLEEEKINSITFFAEDFYVPKDYRINPNIWTINLISLEFGGAQGVKIGGVVVALICLLILISIALEQFKMKDRKARIFKLKVLGCDDVFIDRLGFYETIFVHTIAYVASFIVSCFVFEFLLGKITIPQLRESNIISFNYKYLLTVGIIVVSYIIIYVKHLIEKRLNK